MSRVDEKRPRDRRQIALVITWALNIAVLVTCLLVLLGAPGGQLRKFSAAGLKWVRLGELASLEPIDAHTHVFQTGPTFVGMLARLHMHVLDILYIDDTNPLMASIGPQKQAALTFVDSSTGHAHLCTTFDPFGLNSANFCKETINGLNQDFARGAIAVKIWKNIGLEIKNAADQFVMPDDPLFEPIYRNIAEHHKTLITHVAEPDAAWTLSGFYAGYYAENPQWDMSKKPNAPQKASILRARDHVLEMNPDLRVIGAHFGSMEAHLDDIACRFQRYPNFAVDTAARVASLAIQPRDTVRAFILKYQDRILYGTDLNFYFTSTGNSGGDERQRAVVWQNRYAADWRYFATGDSFEYQGIKTQGLNLPRSVLKKIYHDNAVHWFPGIETNSR